MWISSVQFIKICITCIHWYVRLGTTVSKKKYSVWKWNPQNAAQKANHLAIVPIASITRLSKTKLT